MGRWWWVVSKPILAIIHKLRARLIHLNKYHRVSETSVLVKFLLLSWTDHRTLSKEVRVQYSLWLSCPFFYSFLLVWFHHRYWHNTIPSRYFFDWLYSTFMYFMGKDRVHSLYFFHDDTVPSRYFLCDGIVPWRYFLCDGTVPSWYFLRDGTVPSPNHYLIIMLNFALKTWLIFFSFDFRDMCILQLLVKNTGWPKKKYTSFWSFRGNTGVCKAAK